MASLLDFGDYIDSQATGGLLGGIVDPSQMTKEQRNQMRGQWLQQWGHSVMNHEPTQAGQQRFEVQFMQALALRQQLAQAAEARQQALMQRAALSQAGDAVASAYRPSQVQQTANLPAMPSAPMQQGMMGGGDPVGRTTRPDVVTELPPEIPINVMPPGIAAQQIQTQGQVPGRGMAAQDYGTLLAQLSAAGVRKEDMSGFIDVFDKMQGAENQAATQQATASREMDVERLKQAGALDLKNLEMGKPKDLPPEFQYFLDTFAAQRGTTPGNLSTADRLAAFNQFKMTDSGQEMQFVQEFRQNNPSASIANAQRAFLVNRQLPPQRDPEAAAARESTQLDREIGHYAKPYEKQVSDAAAQLDKVNDAYAMVMSPDAAVQALAIPKVLTATVSGMGSGVRITQAEINSILRARGIQGSLEGFVNNIQSGKPLTGAQQQQLGGVLTGIRGKLTQKYQIANNALDRITGAGSRAEIIAADKEGRRAAGGGMISVRLPDGKTGWIHSSQRDDFLEANPGAKVQ